MAKKILMIVGDFAEDYETMVPFQTLQMLGYEVDTVCPDKKAGDVVATAIHDFTEFQTYLERQGHNFAINKDFDEVKAEDYDGLYLTGGRAPEYLRLTPKVVEIAKYFLEEDKPLGVICHGPQILVATDALKGRKLTGYIAVKPDIENAGATYVEVADDESVVDGNLVSSPAWPGNAANLREFAKVLGATWSI